MSEESQVDTNTEVDEGSADETGSQVELTREELLVEVSKLRRESAKKRVAKKEVDAKLQEYETWKLSQMSELDRAKAEKAKVEETLQELLREKHQAKAAQKAGLDPDFADRIRGETEDEMLADAKALVAKGFKASGSNGAGNLAGKRGKPVGANADQTESSWFREQLSK